MKAPSKWLRKALKWSSVLLVIPALPWIVRQIVFQPTSLPSDFAFSFDTAHKEITLTTADGIELNGLYFPVEQPKGTILYLHGNADNLARWGQYAEDFTRLGFAVWMIEYRSYGKSGSGYLSDEHLYQDALTAYHWIAEQIPSQELIIYGRSLGSGLAVRLAASLPARQLILETPYYSVEDLIGRYLPFWKSGLTQNIAFASYQYIQEVAMPISILHGTADGVVPYAEGQKLAALVPEATFITIEGGRHKNLRTFELYHQALEDILLP